MVKAKGQRGSRAVAKKGARKPEFDWPLYQQESMREPYGRGADASDPLARNWSVAPPLEKDEYPRNIPGQRKDEPTRGPRRRRVARTAKSRG